VIGLARRGRAEWAARAEEQEEADGEGRRRKVPCRPSNGKKFTALFHASGGVDKKASRTAGGCYHLLLAVKVQSRTPG